MNPKSQSDSINILKIKISKVFKRSCVVIFLSVPRPKKVCWLVSDNQLGGDFPGSGQWAISNNVIHCLEMSNHSQTWRTRNSVLKSSWRVRLDPAGLYGQENWWPCFSCWRVSLSQAVSSPRLATTECCSFSHGTGVWLSPAPKEATLSKPFKSRRKTSSSRSSGIVKSGTVNSTGLWLRKSPGKVRPTFLIHIDLLVETEKKKCEGDQLL